MKTFLESMVVAFGMYSKLPMPKIEWNNRNMKYCICFFPLIGLAIGLLENLWYVLAVHLGTGQSLMAAVLVVIPLAVSGGIHMDGLLDTSDAIGSWRTQEERLEIMKDSHSGAFAIIAAVVFILLDFAGMTEVTSSTVRLIGIGFILSRAYSGFGLLMLKKAKNTGLLRTFSDMAANKRAAVVMVCWILASSLAMICLDPLRGSILAGLALLTFFWYRSMAYRQFGGITGDVAGFFLQICELVIVLGAAFMKL